MIFHTVDIAQHFIERTKTMTGLGVTVRLLDKVYQTGRKYAVDFKHTMKIVFDDFTTVHFFLLNGDMELHRNQYFFV